MSLNEEERKIIVGLEIEKAENIVSQINELEKLSYWDNIANRLYYALFHAVSVCAYQTSEDEIKPLIYPTIELIKRIKLYINK